MRSKAPPPNKAEADRIVAAKSWVCIPCYVWAHAGNMPLEDIATESDYDHSKSGNKRRGHAYGFASCYWHHRRGVSDGWTHKAMTEHYGPSLMDGSKLFARTYGTDDELIELQNKLLGTHITGETP